MVCTDNIKITCYTQSVKNNKDLAQVFVSIAEIENNLSYNCGSPSDIIGFGSCFDDAFDDYLDKLNHYLEALTKFKNEVLETSKCYEEVIEVDYMGIPIVSSNN